MREPLNIKISEEILLSNLETGHSAGINFTEVMINAMMDGIKTHTCRVWNPKHKKNPYPEGKVLYVRETVLYNPKTKEKIYLADLDDPEIIHKFYKQAGYERKSSFYMPREFSRIAIRITESKMKLLHDLTHEERLAEGLLVKQIGNDLQYFDYDLHFFKFNLKNMSEEEASMRSFKSLWNKIHSLGAWDENPNIWSFYFQPMIIKNGLV